METIEFEEDVIDRLARIETEQQQIKMEIVNVKKLEERVAKLEGEMNQKKGKMAIFNSLLVLLGAGIGSVFAVIVSRVMS